MAELWEPQTVEIFNRENTNGNTDWTLSGSGTGEYYKTVSGYDADSLFYAGNTLLASGTAGALTAGQFNLTATTLTVRLPDDSLAGISGDTSPDSAPTGHVKGFNQAQTDVISAVAASTEWDVKQVALINEDKDHDANVKVYRIESDGTVKSLTSIILLTKSDTIYMGAFGLQTGEKFAVISTGAISVDLSVLKRSTS